MVIGMLFCSITVDFVIIYLRNQFYTTYYNDDKIEQRLLFKKKSICINEVKHIILVGNVIVLARTTLNLTEFPKNVGRLLKELDNNILIQLGNSDAILLIISKINDAKLDCIKPTKVSLKRMKKYFKINI